MQIVNTAITTSALFMRCKLEDNASEIASKDPSSYFLVMRISTNQVVTPAKNIWFEAIWGPSSIF